MREERAGIRHAWEVSGVRLDAMMGRTVHVAGARRVAQHHLWPRALADGRWTSACCTVRVASAMELATSGTLLLCGVCGVQGARDEPCAMRCPGAQPGAMSVGFLILSHSCSK
eukprot:6153756-Prymnesium_polylepis.1